MIKKGDKNLKINISIDSCLFHSNDGAVSALPIRSSISINESNNILSVRNSLFLNNRGSKVTFDLKNVNVTFQSSCFVGNNATHGGAISVFTSVVFINSTEFTDNHASRVGGAIIQFLSSLKIHHSSFNNNSAIISGGAVHSQDPRELTLKDTEFNHNTANVSGGAIYYVQQSPIASHAILLRDCRFESIFCS